MKKQKTMVGYFGVKNLEKTRETHAGRVEKLKKATGNWFMIQYSDILGTDALSTIDTEVFEKLQLWRSMDMTIKPRQVATLINAVTRQVIGNALEFYKISRTYDTAFYLTHFDKVNEDMTALLQNVIDRGQIDHQ